MSSATPIPIRHTTRRAFLAEASLATTSALSLAQCVWGDESEAKDPVTLEVTHSWHIDHAAHHVQGLAVQDESFWITGVDTQADVGWVFRVDRKTLKVVQQARHVDGDRYHAGGIQLVGRALWVPLAEYRPHSTSTVRRLDAYSLCTIESFEVEDHIGAIAFDGDDRLYAANWDSRQVYTFDTAGKKLDVIDNPTDVQFQDIEYHDGALLGIGRTDVNGKRVGVVVAFDPESREVRDRWLLTGTTRSGDADFGREGFSVWRKRFFAMPEDGPNTTVYEFSSKPS